MFKSEGCLKSFARDCRGATAVIFGVAAVPLLLAAGVAVEFSALNRAQAELQALSDAAALAAAGAYALGNEGYGDIASNSMQENKKGGLLEDVAVVPTSTPNDADKTMTVEATVNVPNTLGSLVGQDYTQINVRSKVALPVFSDHHKGEIVFVLDYSWSMTETVNGVQKWQTLRNEAVELVNELTQNGDNSDVKIGLVPFSNNVRVTMPRNYYNGQTSSSSWTRCVDDRRYPYNRDDTPPSTSPASHITKFVDVGSCSSSFGDRNLNVRDLTTNHAGTVSAIQAMQPYNMTAISLGMEWGYHLLSPSQPYTSAVSFGDADTLKAVVLLTDGRQTMDGWGPGNIAWQRSVEHAEANLVALCENMKADGIRVITVSFDLADSTEAETEERLQNCSGDINTPDGDYYFNANNNARPHCRLRRDPRSVGAQDVPRRVALSPLLCLDGRAASPAICVCEPSASKKRMAGAWIRR